MGKPWSVLSFYPLRADRPSGLLAFAPPRVGISGLNAPKVADPLKSPDIQHEIIRALSHDARGLDQFQIAASIGQATVRVSAELKALEREQLVYQAEGRLWKLTAGGHERA